MRGTISVRMNLATALGCWSRRRTPGRSSPPAFARIRSARAHRCRGYRGDAPPADDGRQFPREVDRVADAGVHALARRPDCGRDRHLRR